MTYLQAFEPERRMYTFTRSVRTVHIRQAPVLAQPIVFRRQETSPHPAPGTANQAQLRWLNIRLAAW